LAHEIPAMRSIAAILNSTVMKYLLCVVGLLISHVAGASEHPGNVHVLGENVRVPIPATWAGWRVVDIDGQEIDSGKVREGHADLGELPIGYFEVLEQDGPGKITAAVVAKNEPVKDTPIAIDAAVSWFYPDAELIRDACKLCRLGGVEWVRDRSSWPELETSRGTWAGDTRYERAMRIQHEAGLKVLQVNHISPGWATSDPSRFPEDLRDVYNYCHGIAKRWNGLADAIEPWNEPDILLFGGHTGCEIASFQKAAYLGLKAGNPKQPVCATVFALDRAETLDEYGANEVYPYFDRYDLHHYIGLDAYSRAYGRHRAISGGRPLWTTEFNLTINWSDAATQEPSEEDLRVQGYRVGKVFAHAIHEGCEKAFYFILGHYVERQLQYGIVHHDLTPRPAYVAFAATGRLLNGAKPIGQVDLGDAKVKAFVFKTVVDGAERETLIAWSETVDTPVRIETAEKSFDYLGREREHRRRAILTREPVYWLLPPGGSKALKVAAPRAKPKWQKGEAVPVVLQLAGKGDFKQSAFAVNESKDLRLIAYNFGDSLARGKLVAEGGKLNATDIAIEPGERKELSIATNGEDDVTVRLELENGAGQAIVSARLTDSPSPPDTVK